jgi:multisubunit Na+/H+ antiporter MnhC subunit
MDLLEVILYLKTHPVIIFIIMMFAGYFMYRKPKLTATIIFIVLILIGIIALISYISSSGVSSKKELIEKSQQQNI